MYNPYENNNGVNPEVNSQPVQTPVQPVQTPPVYQQAPVQTPNYINSNPNVIRYTNVTNPPQPPVNKKKEKSSFSLGKMILAVALAVVISTTSSLGIFVGLVKTGFVTVESDETAAFTISKVVNTGNTNVSGEVGVLTNQEIAAKVLPSVVCIQNYQVNNKYGIMGTNTSQSSEVYPAGEGSGIVMSEDGYIVTNAHVVEDATDLKVILHDGTTHEATLIGADEVTDLAVIKVDDAKLTPAEFGSSDDLQVADTVMAVGNPGGMSFNSSVTIGYVSALNREIESGDYTMKAIQTDAAINPGNSGGALVNQYGQVVGINSSKFVKTGYEGLGFAIPIDSAQPIISDLQNYGYVKDRAVIGISGTFIDEITARFYGLSSGMYVAEATSENAKQSGLKEGDVITSIDGVKIESTGTITSLLVTKKPGDTVTLTVDRALEGKENIEISLRLSEFVAE